MGGKLEFKKVAPAPRQSTPSSELLIQHATFIGPLLIQSSNTQSLHVTGLYEFSTVLFRFPKAELDRPNLICLIHQAMRNAI